MKKNEIELNGEVYIRKDSINTTPGNIEHWITKNKEGKTLCVVRTYSAGVFYGWVNYEDADGFNIEIFEAVRIWKWDGAFTLSEVATNGVKQTENCKFGVELPVVKINRWIELIPMSEKAITSLNKIKRTKYEDL
jgi:hypothetical protein